MITLQYPYSAPTTTLTLRNPQYGDADQFEQLMKIKYTMSGKAYSYVSPVINEHLVLKFSQLRDADVVALRAYNAILANDFSKYTDAIGHIWKVRVVSNPIAITHVRDCLYETTLELRGNKIS